MGKIIGMNTLTDTPRVQEELPTWRAPRPFDRPPQSCTRPFSSRWPGEARGAPEPRFAEPDEPTHRRRCGRWPIFGAVFTGEKKGSVLEREISLSFNDWILTKWGYILLGPEPHLVRSRICSSSSSVNYLMAVICDSG